MFLGSCKFSRRHCLLGFLFLIIGLGYVFLVDTIHLYGFSYDLVKLGTVSNTLIIKETGDNDPDIQEVQVTIKTDKDGMLYILFMYEDNKVDVFKVVEEDLEYIDSIMNNKEYIFQRGGSFYRGRYVFYMKFDEQGSFKTSIEPVLVLDQPRTVLRGESQYSIRNDDGFDEVLDVEGSYRSVDINYVYQKNHFDFIVFKKSFSKFKPLGVKDLEALISKRMYLDLGNGLTEVLVVDVGKQRFYSEKTLFGVNEKNEENPIELDPFVLVVPVDPLGGNKLGLDRNITDEDEFIAYLTHISTLKESPLYKEGRNFAIGYNELGFYSLHPLQDVDSRDFFIHRYTYVTPISILKALNLKERKKFFRPKLFADDRAYVNALRKNLSLNAYTKKGVSEDSFSNEGSFHFLDSVNERLIIWDSLVPKYNECKKLFGVF